jgi:hypothetical protein
MSSRSPGTRARRARLMNRTPMAARYWAAGSVIGRRVAGQVASNHPARHHTARPGDVRQDVVRPNAPAQHAPGQQAALRPAAPPHAEQDRTPPAITGARPHPVPTYAMPQAPAHVAGRPVTGSSPGPARGPMP